MLDCAHSHAVAILDMERASSVPLNQAKKGHVCFKALIFYEKRHICSAIFQSKIAARSSILQIEQNFTGVSNSDLILIHISICFMFQIPRCVRLKETEIFSLTSWIQDKGFRSQFCSFPESRTWLFCISIVST